MSQRARIIVATDLSKSSMAALHAAVEIAQGGPTHISVVHSVPEFPGMDAGAQPSQLVAELTKALNESVAKHLPQQVSRLGDDILDTRVVMGDPEVNIGDAANEANADLVIIGPDTRNDFVEILTGALSRQLARSLER